MSENQKYKLKYDKLRESNPTKRQDETASSNSEAENKLHDAQGSARNICFAWPNGNRKFFNYSYLVSGDLNLEGEFNVITLNFTSDTVTLKGYSLLDLFTQLTNHTPSLITQDDPRYAATREENSYALIDIAVTPLL